VVCRSFCTKLAGAPCGQAWFDDCCPGLTCRHIGHGNASACATAGGRAEVTQFS
jgi:hypothetical protein